MKARDDITYCTSKTCKNKCWRHVDNWEFEGIHSFIERCRLAETEDKQ